MNVMTAAGLCIAAGEAPAAVFEVLPKLIGVRGRMQLAGRRENGACALGTGTTWFTRRWRGGRGGP